MTILDNIFGGIILGGLEISDKLTKPIDDYRAKRCDENIKAYADKLRQTEHPSAKIDTWVPKEVQKRIDDLGYFNGDAEKSDLRRRSYNGWYVALHVIAYYSGRELDYGDNWYIWSRIASNMLCREFKLSEIYGGLDKYNGLTLKDFDIDSGHPIITEETIREAFKVFPCPELVKHIKGEEKQEKISPIFYLPYKGNDNEITIDDVLSVVLDKNSVDTEPDPIPSPIKKINPKSVINPENFINVPDVQKKKFESTFGQFLADKKWYLNKLKGGPIECVVQYDNPDGSENFVGHIIDPGLSTGDEYYVVAQTSQSGTGNTIPVHPAEVDILRKVFDSKGEKYVLTPEEHQRCLSHLFKNTQIYSVFDFSNMGDKLRKLKTEPDKFRKFGQKLTFIINMIENTPKMGRLRFSNWNGIDDFEVCSKNDGNNKVRSPFPGENLTNLSGVVITVTGDFVTVEYEGTKLMEEIEEYGII